jgi:flagellar motor switch protein FliN/FliY|tara:strand:- start:506 stop:802 length:297 start_codon:yes stop_codon:yes gene_type:complete
MADNEPGKDAIVTKETELEALLDVDVEITAVLGTSMMPISQILKLGRGAVVELNRNVGEDIEIHANNRIVAHGEVVVIDDRLGVNLTDIVVMVEAQKG